jgi:pyruvate kinase
MMDLRGRSIRISKFL